MDTLTSSSAATGILTQIYGLRIETFTINSTLAPGLYAGAFRFSTSSAGNSSVLRTMSPVIDNPMPVGAGFIGNATNASNGYVDGGVWSVTSATLPASFALTNVLQTMNATPYFKIGAV
jgi:hypothetical protein